MKNHGVKKILRGSLINTDKNKGRGSKDVLLSVPLNSKGETRASSPGDISYDTPKLHATLGGQNTPGMSRKNTLRTISLGNKMPRLQTD